MNVTGPSQPKTQTYDPSNGPSPSNMTVASRAVSVARSWTNDRSNGGAVKTDLCVLTNRTRGYFNRGDIISVPVHKTNRDPNAGTSDPNLTKTKYGGVYSKRRMLVVLWITYESLFCVPLHTYTRTGLSKKPKAMWKEFVCVKNEGDDDFVNQGDHAPVEANCRHGLDVNTVIPLGDHVEVGFKDDIALVGEMTNDGFIHLLALWEAVAAQAKQEVRRQGVRKFLKRVKGPAVPAIAEGP